MNKIGIDARAKDGEPPLLLPTQALSPVFIYACNFNVLPGSGAVDEVGGEDDFLVPGHPARRDRARGFLQDDFLVVSEEGGREGGEGGEGKGSESRRTGGRRGGPGWKEGEREADLYTVAAWLILKVPERSHTVHISGRISAPSVCMKGPTELLQLAQSNVTLWIWGKTCVRRVTTPTTLTSLFRCD